MKCQIALTEIKDNIFLAEFENMYSAGMTFIRLSEFYESAFHNIRKHHFELEEYMDVFAKHYGNFNYTSRWCGYNVPGNVVLSFLEKFPDLRDKELVLFEKLGKLRKSADDQFYLIGSLAGKISTIRHEVAHGFYYLDKTYRKAMNDETKKTRCYNRLCKKLLKMGYAARVLKDECQAFLGTSDAAYLKHMFGIEGDYKGIREIFRKKNKS